MTDTSSSKAQSYVRRFRFSPDETEYVENYFPSGFHPISIGDCFAGNRYRILHKLGNGASSTVWLARDQQYTNPGRLVALKAHRAYVSTTKYNHELAIQDILQNASPPIPYIQTVEDHFFVDGPNGTHLFLIHPLAGPSIFTMREEMWKKKLRGDLARKVIKQIMSAVEGLHRVGIIHGDITPKNILFSLKPNVIEWTDEEVYDILGTPSTFKVETNDGTPLPPCVPAELIYPTRFKRLMSPSFLEEKIVLADFGQSYPSTIHDFLPGPQVHYQAPEAHFEKRAREEADVWALACTIYEIFSNYELFSSYFGHISDILVDNVAILGRFPDPWWEKFEQRNTYFLEDGEPKIVEVQGMENYKIKMSSIREELRKIGVEVGVEMGWEIVAGESIKKPVSDENKKLVKDTPTHEELRSMNRKSLVDEGKNETMFEKTKVRFSEREVELLGDLLERMLKHHPDDRIKIQEVLEHPWLTYLC